MNESNPPRQRGRRVALAGLGLVVTLWFWGVADLEPSRARSVQDDLLDTLPITPLRNVDPALPEALPDPLPDALPEALPDETPPVPMPASNMEELALDEGADRASTPTEVEEILPDVFEPEAQMPAIESPTSISDSLLEVEPEVAEGVEPSGWKAQVETPELPVQFVSDAVSGSTIEPISFPQPGMTPGQQVPAPPEPRPPLPDALPSQGDGPLLSLRIEDQDIRRGLELLGAQAGVNIITSPGVTGTVNVALEDVTFDQALDVLLRLAGLVARQENDLVFVYSAEEADELMRREREPVVRVYHLNYVRAVDLYPIIGQFLSEDGTIALTPPSQQGIGAPGMPVVSAVVEREVWWALGSAEAVGD